MTDKEKISLVDTIIEQIRSSSDVLPVMIGALNKPTGLNGFQRAEIGHPVFEFEDRYFILLTSLDGKTQVKVTYRKETFAPAITLIK